jgi:hypothetical protein
MTPFCHSFALAAQNFDWRGKTRVGGDFLGRIKVYAISSHAEEVRLERETAVIFGIMRLRPCCGAVKVHDSCTGWPGLLEVRSSDMILP